MMAPSNTRLYLLGAITAICFLYILSSGGIALISKAKYTHLQLDMTFHRSRTKGKYDGCQVSTFRNSELSQAIHSWKIHGLHPRKMSYSSREELEAAFDRVFQFYQNVYNNYTSIKSKRKWYSEQFSHNISSRTSGKHLKLFIREFMNKQPTKGGSVFRIILEGNEKVLCDVHDSFDGNYTACCPLVTGCSDVTVILQYTDFEPFVQRELGDARPELNKQLKKFKWCPPYKTSTKKSLPHGKTLIKPVSLGCRNKTIQDFFGGRWLRTDNGWRWGTADRCVFNYMTRDEVMKCYNKLNSITFIGDSHLRNTGDYFLELLGYNMLNVTYHRHYDFIPEPKISILWAPWPDTTIEKLVNLTKDHTNVRTSNDVIIIMTGQWDFWMRGPIGFFEESSKKLVSAIKSFKQDPYWGKSKVIWMQQIAYPRGITQAGFRSNPLSSAANSWMEDKLRDVAVDVIDSLHVTRPLYYHNYCGCHYMCREWDRLDHSVGEVGKTLAQLLFKHMCGMPR